VTKPCLPENLASEIRAILDGDSCGSKRSD
jgi:hypothetical protein